MKNYKWFDRQGISHGDWCREHFFECTCKYCQQTAWYFQCSHGCRVYFHEVPWINGTWNPRCPVYHANILSDDFKYILDDYEEFNYKIQDQNLDYFDCNLSEKTKDEFNFNLDTEETKDEFNFNLDEDEDEDNFNYQLD